MKKILLMWIIVIALLTTSIILIGIKRNNKDKEYKAFENDLVEAAKVYFGQDTNLKKLPQRGKRVSITIEELEKFGIKINNNINGEKCNGKVEVTGKSISYIYKANIKCNNYETN